MDFYIMPDQRQKCERKLGGRLSKIKKLKYA